MQYYVVDAFAENIFEGNPAGVCVLESEISDGLMQKIAMENNLSETAFLRAEGERLHLRWFTPGGEINLCGHATLGTAFVVSQILSPGLGRMEFDTLSGVLTVSRRGDLFEMDFPCLPPAPYPVTEDMELAVGLTPLSAYLDRDLILVLESESQVRACKPDFAQMMRLPEGLGVLITAPSGDGRFDFVSRCFYPKLKVPEDPVTGSAHCHLIPYWADRLGKNELTARQLSARGGTLFCRLDGGRVKISGRAALYCSAQLHI